MRPPLRGAFWERFPPWYLELWDGINDLVAASGGDPGCASVARQNAVVRIERALEDAGFARPTAHAPPVIEFRVALEPKPKNSRRVLPVRSRDGSMRHRMVESEEFRAWERAFLLLARRHAPRQPLSGAVEVELVFALPRPRRLGGGDRVRHDRRPDAENLAKGVHDALSQLGFWTDDGQVSDLVIRKRYAASGEAASIGVKIMEAR